MGRRRLLTLAVATALGAVGGTLATAGTVNTNSNNDSIVKGALTSRNSFLGVSGDEFGAIKLGKTDAPMKTSTARKVSEISLAAIPVTSMMVMIDASEVALIIRMSSLP